MAKPRTLYDKIWDDHLVDQQPDGTCLLYIDRHLVHEVTSPQAFEGLRNSGRKVRAPEKTLAVVDHNIPTSDVPMPCASAPNAPCVEVWLSPHTMVVPGSVKPCSGPMMCTMP